MDEFCNYLFSKGIANEKSVKYYKMWVSKYLDFHDSNSGITQDLDDIDQFISMLSEKYADWQLNQANEAVRAFYLFKARKTTPLDPHNGSTDSHWKQVAD